MIKSIFPILFIFLSVNSGNGQCGAISCSDSIYICSFGENIIYGQFDGGPYVVHLVGDGSISYGIVGVVASGNQLIFSYNQPLGEYLSSTGTYIVECENGNNCWGYYTFGNCIDDITFDACLENVDVDCGVWIPKTKRRVCLGDTSIATISPFLEESSDLNEPFHPDRIECSVGTVIDYSENQVSILWTEVGEDCLNLNSTTVYGSKVESGIGVSVYPTDPMIVTSDKGDLESAIICRGEEIKISIESSSEVEPKLEINGSIYYGFENNLSFEQAGEYDIIISDQDGDECSCIPDAHYKIIVEDGDSPAIECKRTVCLGEATTYYSATECDSYIWEVGSGGAITAGGEIEDSYVTVEWNVGPTNEISLSTPSCFENICKSTIVETINIINPSISIEGLDFVCEGDLVTYSTPNFTGTDFFWDAGSQGNVIFGQGTNLVKIRWNADAGNSTGVVSVSYNNCNLDCNGYAELPVSILPLLEIEYTSTDLCRNTEYTFSTNIGTDVEWILKDKDGNMTPYSPSSSLSLSFVEAGNYTLEIINSALISCNTSDILHFQVLEDIPSVIDIDGPKVICLGKLNKYTVPGLSNEETVIWEVVDGGAPMNLGSSKSLFHIWISNGPYEISVSIYNSISGCVSTRTSFLLNNDISLEGQPETCLGDEAQYFLPEYDGEAVSWNISPPSAGTIIETKEDWVRVIWSQEGTHTASAIYCDRNLELDVTVHPLPTANYIFDKKVCHNESSSLNVITSADNTVEIYNSNKILLTTDLSANLFAGNYFVDVVSPAGCTSRKEILIEELEDFSISINTLSPQGVCPPFNPFELFIESVSSNYSYQWYHNNSPIGGNSPSLIVDELGTYYLIVTDKNGCRATSNSLSVVLCCSSGSGSTGIPGVTMDITTLDCNNRDFEILEPFESTTFDWSFGDPYSTSNAATGISVSHKFSRAGTYLVRAVGDAYCDYYDIDVCGVEQSIYLCQGTRRYVEIPLVADFSFEARCVNDTSVFIDETTMLPSIGNVSYSWDFGDPMSSNNTSNTQAPTHIFNNPGTYTVTLEVTAAGVCASTISKEIEIKDGPSFEIVGKANYCIGLLSIFRGITSEQNLNFEWNFGDPGSGNNNTANSALAKHIFSAFGTFTVTLSATDDQGCTTTISQEIEVVDNQLEGDITADISNPKCPDDLVTLTAPSGGTDYLWNTGDSTATIQVMDESTYSVTVMDAAGCEYTPWAFDVFNYEISGVQIYSEKNNEVVYDSIEVCLGDPFNVYATEVSNVTYEWTVDEDNSVLEFEEHFESLVPGRYSFSVSVTDSVGGCNKIIGPFIVNIHEKLEAPEIYSEDGNHCENNLITLRMDSYDANNTYAWSNGLSGESITVVSAGSYMVTVTNEIGCEAISEEFNVRPNPGTNEWMTGCMEVCFPREFCLNLNNSNDYELIHSGINTGLVDNSFSTLDLNQPGDYQILVTNEYGCESMSEILSLSAIPVDQTLSGIVYLDVNENSTFDADDVLQEGVVVYLMNGNTIVGDTITDANGYYNFDPVFQTNLRVVLDLASIDFTFEGVSDSTLIYDFCIEDKEVNFPLISICTNPIRVDSFYTCPDEPLLINGVMYNANDIDTSIIPLNSLCDSTHIINVYAYEDPIVFFDTNPSCSDDANGELIVNSQANNNLEYSLSPDFSIIDTTYSDLSAGTFTLYVRNMEGCQYSFPFTIDEVEEPEFALIGMNTCVNESDGTLEIDVIQGSNLLYSLEPDANFSDELVYNGLAEGMIQVYVKDSLGCIYIDEIEIENFDSPQIDLVPEVFCEGDDFAMAHVQVLEGNPIFSMDDAGVYSSDNIWEELATGPHVLYIESQYGCHDSINFVIEALPVPEMEIIAHRECESLTLGSIEVLTDAEDLEFSLDGSNYSSQIEYEDLAADSYTLYTKTMEGCLFESPFEIELFNEPELHLFKKGTCKNDINGYLEVSAIDSEELLYSIDGTEFITDTIFENLDMGDYTLYVKSDENDCAYEVPFEIIQIPVPEVNITENNTCGEASNGIIDIQTNSGSGLTFDIEGDGIFSEETRYEDQPQGEYTIAVRDQLGCTYEYSASIISIPEPEFEVEIENSCDNIDNGAFTILSEHMNVLTSIDGSSFESVMSYNDLAAGLYEVAIIDSNLCVKTQTIEIPSNPPLEIAIEDYSEDCYETALEIKPIISSHHGELQYNWNTQASSESILPLESGIYEVTISDFCDEQYLSTEIDISIFNEDDPVYLANVFSPNDDNINDCFQAVVDPNYNVLSFDLKVFDRWGNLFFASSNITDCWDGRFQNKDVSPGVYVYVVEMTIDHCNGIKEVRKMGDVTVLR